MQTWRKGSYFREHQTFLSPFPAQTPTSTDTPELGDPQQYIPELHNSPGQGTVHTFTPWKCQSLKISGWAEYRRVFNIHWLSLFGRVFSLFFSNLKYFQHSRGSSSEAPLGQCNGKLRGLWATLRSGNRRSGALKGKQRWPKSRHQWLKAYRVWLFYFKNLKCIVY